VKTVKVFRSSGALCLLLLLLHVNSRAQGAYPTAAPTGKVTGRVLDFDPQKPEFILEGEGVKQVVTVDERGNFEIGLPAGIYHVVAPGGAQIIPPDNIFRRASFRVNPNATVRINISSLRDRVYCTRFGKVLRVIANVWEGKEEEVEDPRPKYDTLWLPKSTREPRDVVVEYCGKKESRGLTLYENVTLTHNKFRITATYIKLNKKTFLVYASGREVIIEDGSKMIIKREATVDLITNQYFYPRSKRRSSRDIIRR